MPELLRSRQSPFSVRHYRTLLDVAEAISAHRDLDALLQDLASQLPRIVSFDVINLVLYDPARDVMRLHALVAPESNTTRPGMEFSLNDTSTGLVWESQQPLVVEDVAAEDRFPKLTSVLRENGVQSYCTVPLTTALRRLGAMSFGSSHARAYHDDEINFMQQVAKQVAVAVDNVLHEESARQAHEQLTRERDRVRLLLDVNNAVISHLDLDELFRAVSSCLRRLIQHDFAALVLHDDFARRYRVHVLQFASNESFIEEGDRASSCCPKSPAATAIANRKPTVFSAEDLDVMASESHVARKLLSLGIKFFCSVPLLLHERALGALNVGRTHENKFSSNEVELLTEVSKQIAIAVENSQAYREITQLKDRLAKENFYLEQEVRTNDNFGEIVGNSLALRRILNEVETVASTDSTVLVCGETGTGKELIARALHDLSPRRDRTFVKLNCAAIPTGLLESELFGHEKGAFTGAITQKIGRFELAHEGTLFLDEIGDIPSELQPKLLRALQEKEFERLGSTDTRRVDVRLVAATNRNLARMVSDGKFRSDLYYRLNVFPVVLPPLRERREDIPMLARHFAQRFARRMGRCIEAIPTAVMDALVRYSWPGNIREMQNVIERAVILSPGPSLDVAIGELSSSAPQMAGASPTAVTFADVERNHILAALRESRWIVGGPRGAAVRLGIKRTTLQWKMKNLGIARPQ